MNTSGGNGKPEQQLGASQGRCRQLRCKPFISHRNEPESCRYLPNFSILTKSYRKFPPDSADNCNVSFCFSKTVIVRQLFCFVFILGFVTPCFAQEGAPDTDKRFTADVLKTTLFARTPEEKKFCDYVIQKRDDGTIPPRLLYGVYQKSLTHDRNRRFTYFKTALEITCQREGITLYPTPVRTSSTTSTPSFITFPFRGLFQRN